MEERVTNWKKYKACNKSRIKVPASLQDLIEIKSISEDGIFEIGAGGMYSKTYEVADINYELLHPADKVLVLNQWCELSNSMKMPFKLTIVKQEQEAPASDTDFFPLKGDTYDSLRNQLNEEVARRMKSRKSTQKIYLTLHKQAGTYQEAAAAFSIVDKNLASLYRRLGSALTALPAEDKLKLLHSFYHMGDSQSFSFSTDSGRSIYDSLMPGKMDFTNDNFFLVENGGRKKYHACLYLKDFGTELPDAFLIQLLALDISLAVSVDCNPISKQDAQGLLSHKYSHLSRLIEKQSKERVKRLDFSSETTKTVSDDYKEIKEQMDECKDENQQYFYTRVTFLVSADTKEELENACNLLISAAGDCGTGCVIDYCYMRQREAFNTVLPAGGSYHPCGRNVQTRVLASFAPFRMQRIYDENGLFYGHNQVTNELIRIDRKKYLNPHAWIFGVTGAGKTATAMLMMLEAFLNTEDDILVIDPKNDYIPFAEKVHGTFFDVSPESGLLFNPFSCESKAEADKKSELLLALTSTCKGAPLDAREQAVLEKARKLVYNRMPPDEVTLTDIYQALPESGGGEIAEDLMWYLQLFVDGALSIFARKSNVDMENRVTVFGLKNMGKKLQEIGMLIMFEYIKARVYNNFKNQKATWIFIDEATRVLQTPEQKEYINSCWKLFRSLGAILTGMTQNVTSMLDTYSNRELIENSTFILLMKQKPASKPEIKKNLDFTDAELDYLFSKSNPGTGLIKIDNTVVPFDLRVRKDTELYQMINTDFHEKVREAGDGR